MRRIAVVSAGIAAILCLALGMALAADPAPAAAPAPAAPPPEPAYLSMKVALLDGGETQLKSILKKEKTALVFFQSACSACRGELDFLKEELKGKEKVEVIGVSVDTQPELVKGYIASAQIPFKFLSDPQFTLAAAFDISATPATVILDGKGNLVKRMVGYKPAMKKELLDTLLK